MQRNQNPFLNKCALRPNRPKPKRRRSEQADKTPNPKEQWPVSDEFLLLLAKTKDTDLHPGKKVILKCQRSDSLTSVFKTLSSNKILSMPVLTKSGKFWGFIDILDIIKFMVDLVGEHIYSKKDFDFFALEEFQNSKVKDIMKYPVAKLNPFHPVMSTQSLLSVCEVLSTGVHRVPIINGEQELVNIVTQSSMLKFIYDHMEQIGGKRKMKLKWMAMSDQYVLSVNQHEKAIDAFKLMKICKVSGVAVVSDHDKLVGNISAHDIKRITSTARWISRLFTEASTFVQQAPVCVKKTDTLETLITTLVNNKIHRVYVVDDKHVPIGVLSLTDIINELIHSPKIE